MRVTDRSQIAALQNASASQRSTAPSARFTLGGADATGKAISSQAAMPVGAMNGLLALQAAGDTLERQKRAMRRGHNLLDSLDKLKLALLSGRVPTASLEIMAAQLKQRRETVDDPKLEELMGHIELRAEVELAKLARR